ncbi:uncharacterized protein K02A2.6-like [Malaya genurostris]|uniref:uncharacterized protein K02A2.6-like n=1 Tax=Malaya genurostris TaxID=325434 RepID=UPI0026F3A48F|nr:uncharacterized protein K02A2.6-like [Malaya genurostris]
MFVCGLKSDGDGEIRTRLLAKIEERDDVTLEHLSEDCQRLLCLKRDTAMIESSASTSSVNFIKRKQQFSKRQLFEIDLMDTFGLFSLPISMYCNNVSVPAITLQSLKAAYPSVFRNELGLCTKTKVKLERKLDATPVFRPKRPVAYAVHSMVDNELDRLERAKIITPEDFSDWAAPIVVVRKTNGSIRICGDYSTGLNNALQPHQYPLPLPEEIFNKLANCTVFSRIDLSDAFLQVEVDESSRDLLTINTHSGLYRYNRLPPEVKTAPGAFQQLIDTMLGGLPHTCGYLDDVVVGDVTTETHWENLRAVFQRISEFGFTIRVEKCIFAEPQIKYVGHLLDRNGLRPDPAKVQAINVMPPPTDVSGVRSFLGAINYYAKFGNADILSRLISQHVRPKEDYVIASVSLENDLRIVDSLHSPIPLPRQFIVTSLMGGLRPQPMQSSNGFMLDVNPLPRYKAAYYSAIDWLYHRPIASVVFINFIVATLEFSE